MLEDTTLMTREAKAKINKGDYIKLKFCYTATETRTKIKGQSANQENIFACHKSSNGDDTQYI